MAETNTILQSNYPSIKNKKIKTEKKKKLAWDFPISPVVKTPGFH